MASLADTFFSYLPDVSPEGTQAAQQSGVVPDKDSVASRVAADVGVGLMNASTGTGPAAVYGIAGALLDKARNGGTITENMFSKEGLANLHNDQEKFVTEFERNNPSAKPDDVKAAYDEYTKTPQYTSFFAQQLRPGLSYATDMRNKLAEATGTQNPNLADQALQIAGEAIVPNPVEIAGPVAGVVGKVAPSIVAKSAGIGADAIAGLATGTGTSASHFTPIGVATNVAVGTGIDAAVRAGTGQPIVGPINISADGSDPNAPKTQPINLNPIGSAEAADGTIGNTTGFDAGTPTYGPGSGSAPIIHSSTLPSTGVASPQPDNGYTAQALEALGIGAGVAGLALGGRAAYKGIANAIERNRGINDVNFADTLRFQPQGQVAAQRAARDAAGFAQDDLGGFGPTRSISTAINKDAPLEAQARDMVAGQGAQAQVDAEQQIVGAVQAHLSPQTQRFAIGNFETHGILPDGTNAPESMQSFSKDFFTLTPQDQQILNEGVLATQAQQTRIDILRNFHDEYATATNRLAANPTDPDLVAAQARAAQRIQDRAMDTFETRGNAFPHLDDRQVQQAIDAMNNNPVVMQMIQRRRAMLGSLNQMSHRAGVISRDELNTRLTNPDYAPVFEFRGGSLQEVPRDVSGVTDPSRAVNQSVNANMSLFATAATAIQQAQANIGKQRLARMFVQMDPNGRFVRPIGFRDQDIHIPFGDTSGVVQMLYGGRPYVYKFARSAVADAINADHLGLDGFLPKAFNTARKWQQRAITGANVLAGGIGTPIKSVMYDIPNIMATHKEGEAFGLLSLASQLAAHRIAPNSVLASRVANSLSRIDPTSPLVVAGFAGYASLLKPLRAASLTAIEAGLRQDPWFQALAHIPGADRAILGMSHAIVNHYGRSIFGMMERAHIGGPSEMVKDTIGAKNALQDAMSHYRRQPGAIQSAAHTIAQGWYGLLNNIHTAAGVTLAAQTRALRQARLGRALNTTEQTALAVRSHNAVGNLAAIQGGSMLGQSLKLGSITLPYFNIALQTTRHVMKSAFTEGPYQSMNTMLGLGGIAGALYLSHKMFEDMSDAANHYYWDQQSQFDRLSMLHIPTLDNIIHHSNTGSWLPFDPEHPNQNFLRVRLAPELLLHVTPLMGVLEHMGMIQRPKSGVDTGNPLDDIRASAVQASGLGQPTLYNIIMGLTGQNSKIDWSQIGGGRGVVSGINAPNRSLGLAQDASANGLPNYVGNLLRVALGRTGAAVSNMLDVGLGSYKDGDSFSKALQKQGLEVATAFKSNIPDTPLWRADEKLTRSTPEAEAIHQQADALKLIDDQVKLDVSKHSYIFQNSPTLRSDPQMLGLMMMTARMYPALIRAPNRMLAATQAKLDDLQNSRTSQSVQALSSGEYDTQRNHLIASIRSIQDQIVHNIDIYNKTIANGPYGAMLKAQKLPPNIIGVAALLKSRLGDRP